MKLKSLAFVSCLFGIDACASLATTPSVSLTAGQIKPKSPKTSSLSKASLAPALPSSSQTSPILNASAPAQVGQPSTWTKQHATIFRRLTRCMMSPTDKANIEKALAALKKGKSLHLDWNVKEPTFNVTLAEIPKYWQKCEINKALRLKLIRPKKNPRETFPNEWKELMEILTIRTQ